MPSNTCKKSFCRKLGAPKVTPIHVVAGEPSTHALVARLQNPSKISALVSWSRRVFFSDDKTPREQTPVQITENSIAQRCSLLGPSAPVPPARPNWVGPSIHACRSSPPHILPRTRERGRCSSCGGAVQPEAPCDPPPLQRSVDAQE